MRKFEAANSIQVGAQQPHPELVFTAERKVVVGSQTANRAERHSFTIDVLGLIAGSPVGLRPRRRRGIADGQRADAIRGSEIAFEQSGRNVEEISDVVKTKCRIVGKKQRFDIDVKVQQIANRVPVLGAI